MNNTNKSDKTCNKTSYTWKCNSKRNKSDSKCSKNKSETASNKPTPPSTPQLSPPPYYNNPSTTKDSKITNRKCSSLSPKFKNSETPTENLKGKPWRIRKNLRNWVNWRRRRKNWKEWFWMWVSPGMLRLKCWWLVCGSWEIRMSRFLSF